MTVTVLALVTINEDAPEALAAYLDCTQPLLQRAGGRIAQRFQIGEAVVGARPSQWVILVEYPDRAAIDQVFSSAEYHAITEIRDRAFSRYQVSIVEG